MPLQTARGCVSSTIILSYPIVQSSVTRILFIAKPIRSLKPKIFFDAVDVRTNISHAFRTEGE